jgi:FtsX-like permease family
MAGLGLWVRSQWRHRAVSLLALALLVALVGGVTLGVAGAARRADTSIDRFMADTRQANVEVDLDLFDQPSPELLASLPTPAELVEHFKGIDGVRGLTGVSYIGAAPGVDGNPPGADAEYFSAAAGATWGESLRSRFVQGRAADPADPHEVVVNEAAPAAWGVQVGDMITLYTLAPDQLEGFTSFLQEDPHGPRIDVQVVGVFRDLEDITDFPEPILLTTPAFLDRYGEEVVNVTGAAWVNADPGRLDEVVAAVQATAPEGYEAGVVNEDFAGRVREVLSVEVTALQVFAAAAGLVGLAVVFQAVSRHLGAAAGQQFVGRALGLRRRQLVAGSVIAVLPGLAAGLLGAAVLAVAVSAFLPRGVARRADPEPGLWVDWPSLLIGGLLCAVILVGVALLAAGLSVRRARVRSGPGPSRMRGAARHLPLAMPLAPSLGVRYALGRGQGPRRVAWAGVAGAAIGVAGIVAVAAVTGSAHRLLSSPALWGATWDAGASLEGVEDVDVPAQQLAADPDVEAVAFGLRVANPDAVEAEGPAGRADVEPFAFEPVKGDMGPVVREGRPPVGPDEAAVGFTLADRLGIAIGDKVELHTPHGSVGFTMVGRLVFPSNDELGDGLVVTPSGMDALHAGCPADSEDFSCQALPHDVGVRYRPGVDVEQATTRLATVVPSLGPPERPSEVNNLEQVGVTPWLLAGFLAMLGLAGLAHALVIGSRRQRHDLAVARALGLRPGQAAAVVRWQAVVLAAVGACAGLVVGLAAGRLVWQGVADGIGAIVRVDLSPWIVVLVAPAAVIAGLLAATFPAHQVAHQRPAAVLRSE